MQDPHPVPMMDPCTGWTGSGPQPHYSTAVLLASSYTNLRPPPLQTGKAQLLSTHCTCCLQCWVPQRHQGTGSLCPLCAENHRVPSGSALSPLQAQGHRVNHSPLGREHSNFRLLPYDMSLLGHKEVLCSCSIKGICVFLATGTDPGQGKKSSSYSRGSSTGWGQCRDKGALSSSKARGFPLPLLASALPSPSAREATYQNILASTQSTTQPLPQSPVPCLQSRAQFTGETGASCRNVFDL